MALHPVILLLGLCGSTVGPHWIIRKFWESSHVIHTCVTNTVPWHFKYHTIFQKCVYESHNVATV